VGRCQCTLRARPPSRRARRIRWQCRPQPHRDGLPDRRSWAHLLSQCLAALWAVPWPATATAWKEVFSELPELRCPGTRLAPACARGIPSWWGWAGGPARQLWPAGSVARIGAACACACPASSMCVPTLGCARAYPAVTPGVGFRTPRPRGDVVEPALGSGRLPGQMPGTEFACARLHAASTAVPVFAREACRQHATRCCMLLHHDGTVVIDGPRMTNLPAQASPPSDSPSRPLTTLPDPHPQTKSDPELGPISPILSLRDPLPSPGHSARVPYGAPGAGAWGGVGSLRAHPQRAF
jgi:hypothetical protein